MKVRLILSTVMICVSAVALPAQWFAHDGPDARDYEFVSCMTFDGRMLYCGTNAAGVFSLDAESLEWERVGRALPLDGTFVRAIASTRDGLVIATSDPLYVLLRGDSVWTQGNGWNDRWEAHDLAVRGRSVYACTDGVGIKRAATLGSGWEDVPQHPEMGVFTNEIEVYGNVLFAANERGLFKTENDGGRWERVKVDGQYSSAMMIKNIADSVLLAIIVTDGAPNGKLMRSTDDGDTWQELDLAPDGPIEKRFIDERYGTIIMAVENRSIYRSMDGGKHFEEVDAGIAIGMFDDHDPMAVSVVGQRVFASFTNGEVWWRNADQVIVGVHAEAPYKNCVSIDRYASHIDVVVPDGCPAATVDLYDIGGRSLGTVRLQHGVNRIPTDGYVLTIVR